MQRKSSLFLVVFQAVLCVSACAINESKSAKKPLISYGSCGKSSIANKVAKDGEDIKLIYDESLSKPCQ